VCWLVELGISLDPLGCCNSNYLSIPLSIGLPLLGCKRPQCSFCRRFGYTRINFSLHGFPNKTSNILQSNKVEPQFTNEENQEYLKLKSSSQAHFFTHSILSKACISQTLECQS